MQQEKKATAMRERAWTTIHFQFNSLEHKRELLSLRRIKSLAKTVYQLNELFFSLDLGHSCSPLLHCVCTHLRWAHNWQRFLIEIHKEWKQQRKHEYYHWMLIKRKPHIQRNHSRSLLLSLCIFHISSYCHRPGKSWLDQCDAMWCVSSQFKCTTSLHVHLPSNWYNYCFPHVFFSRCRSFSVCVSFHQFIQMAGVELEVKMSFEIKQKKNLNCALWRMKFMPQFHFKQRWSYKMKWIILAFSCFTCNRALILNSTYSNGLVVVGWGRWFQGSMLIVQMTVKSILSRFSVQSAAVVFPSMR